MVTMSPVKVKKEHLANAKKVKNLQKNDIVLYLTSKY